MITVADPWVVRLVCSNPPLLHNATLSVMLNTIRNNQNEKEETLQRQGC